jgi:hypothetical protein
MAQHIPFLSFSLMKICSTYRHFNTVIFNCWPTLSMVLVDCLKDKWRFICSITCTCTVYLTLYLIHHLYMDSSLTTQEDQNYKHSWEPNPTLTYYVYTVHNYCRHCMLEYSVFHTALWWLTPWINYCNVCIAQHMISTWLLC